MQCQTCEDYTKFVCSYNSCYKLKQLAEQKIREEQALSIFHKKLK